MLGEKHPSALGRPFLHVWSEILGDLQPLVDRACAGESVFLDDMRLLMKRSGSREETYFSFAYTSIRREDGVINGVCCPCTKPTRQVLNSRLTAKSEARRRQIFDSAIDYPILATDRDGFVSQWNSGAELTLEWTAADMLGRRFDCFFTPEARAGGRPQIEVGSAQTEGLAPDEHWHQRKSGERLWAMGDMTSLKNDDGGLAGYVKVLRGRTQERLAAEALRQSQENWWRQIQRLEKSVVTTTAERNRLWGTSLDLLPELDTEGIIKGVNPAWTQLLGYMPDEPIGHLVAAFVVSGDAEATAEAAIQGRVEVFTAKENRYRHKDGSVLWFSWVARSANGKIDATGQDVTAIKIAEAVHRGTEDQLRQSQKVEAIGQLTDGVTQDFTSLLKVMQGLVDLLRRPGTSDERSQKYTDAICDTTDRAAKVTGQLFAFARCQSLKPKVFDAAASVRTVNNMVRSLTGPRIKLALRLPSTPCYINADRVQSGTTIVNMAFNAHDAMGGEGALTITVAALLGMPAIRSQSFTPGEFVTVELTDTGAGIPADKIDQTFEPFFATKGVAEGTGLGLQVFGFVKQLSGGIFAEGVKGAGATFTMSLPHAVGEEDLVMCEGDAFLTLGEGACSLVVEDNAEVGIFATEALAEPVYNTVLAMNGVRALAELVTRNDYIDVGFFDVIMPGMSGVELGEEIVRLYPGLPVVLTSGYSEVLAQSGSYGSELLHNPGSIDKLSRVLRRCHAIIDSNVIHRSRS